MQKKILVLMLCAMTVVATGQARDKKDRSEKKTEKADSSASEKPKETDYDKLLKKPHDVAKGMITLHKIDGKLYFEFPLELFGRQMLLGSVVSETSDNLSGVPGSKSNEPLFITFTKVGDQVQIRQINSDNYTSGVSQNMLSSLDKNNIPTIFRNFEIDAYNSDSTAVVFNVTDLFVGHVKELSPFSYLGAYGGAAKESFKKELSYLGAVKSFSDNLTVKSTLSYTFSVTDPATKRTIISDSPFTAVMTRTLVLLDEEPYRPRITDSRMSVFPTGKYLYSDDEQRVKVIYFANRWRLEPSDPEAWQRGELVAPKKPIVFYIDPDFPEKWKPALFEGVSQWSELFAKIGFKDAVQALPYPTDDPEFDPDNIKYSCIRYAPIPIANAMGPSWVDPRSGEILNASVYVFHDVIKMLNRMLFTQTAQADARVRTVNIPDEVILDGLRYVLAHEVGHCLGFMHNMSSSSVIPVDSLRSPSFTAKYGTTTSIMDYARFNYVAQPEDVVAGVRLVNDRLGVYDYFAIRWLYGTIDGADTPEQERAALSRMLTEKAGDPYYYYGNFIYDYYFGDVRLAYTNLGDDPILRTRYRLQNLRYTAAHAAEWLKGKDPDFSYRDEVIADLASGVTEMISYLSAYVGGIYYNEVVEGDGQRMQQVVPKEMQRRALTESLKAIEDLSWLDTELTEGRFVSLSESVQSSGMMTILKKLENLERYQQRLPDSYTPQEMSDDLMAYIFRDVKAGRTLSEYNRQLQQGFVGIVIGYSRVTAQPKSSSSRSAGIQAAADDRTAWGGVSPLRDALYGQPAGMAAEGESPQPFSAYGNYRPRFMVKGVSDHIYYGILLKVRDIYRQGVAVARDASSRDFCRFMLDKVEQSLKTQ